MTLLLGTRRAALRASASIVVLALSAGVAAAQSPGGDAAGAADVQLDAITVTGTKQEEKAIDAMAGVSVITRQELRQNQPQRIGTMINTVPGVSTQENPNDPATAINIRGLQDFGRVAVTVDGARQNFQRSGHNANGAFFLDPAFIRSIDITRGPVANVYGSGAIGGVVSFETVDPSDILKPGERVGAEISGTGVLGRQFGAFGSALGAARASEKFEAMVGFSGRALGTYRDGAGDRVPDSGQDLMSAIGKVVARPADGHTIKIGGQYQLYDFTNGTGTASAPRRENEVETTNLFARYNFSRPDNPWLDLTASAYTTSTETDQSRTSGTPAQLGQSRFFNIRTSGFDLYNTSRAELGPVRVALTYGGDFFEDRVKTSDPFGNGDETTPSGARRVYGGFAQAHATWSIVDVIGAVRYDGYELEGGRTQSDGQRVSPKLTVGVTPFQGFQVYGTYAEGYRAPAITETLVDGPHPVPAAFIFRPNPNLRPEVGKTLEAGVNLKYDNIWKDGDRFRGKVSVFRNDVRDFIDGVFVDPGAPCGSPVPNACADAFYTYQNVSQARINGVEAELIYDARRWFATVSGSVIRGDNRSNGQPLQSIYPDKVTFGGGMRFFDERLTLGGRVTLVDAQKRLPASALATASDAYGLVDLYGSYQVTPDSRAFVTLENVGDVRYRRYRDADESPGFVAKIGYTTRFGS